MTMTIGRSMRLRPVKVMIKTKDGHAITGQINLGTKDRLSDMFIQSGDKFIIILKATFDSEETKEVMILNMDYIAWVEPVAEDREFNEHLYQKGAQKLSY
ncbi:MAG: hypothetical protein KJ737_06180 [Proteobacteria bacterium]|nr:hypothetical protein [Pseudomonadota bacterium]